MHTPLSVAFSRVQTGALRISDVALSMPTVVDMGGAVDIVTPQLDDAEREGLERSAEVLRKAIASL